MIFINIRNSILFNVYQVICDLKNVLKNIYLNNE